MKDAVALFEAAFGKSRARDDENLFSNLKLMDPDTIVYTTKKVEPLEVKLKASDAPKEQKQLKHQMREIFRDAFLKETRAEDTFKLDSNTLIKPRGGKSRQAVTLTGEGRIEELSDSEGDSPAPAKTPAKVKKIEGAPSDATKAKKPKREGITEENKTETRKPRRPKKSAITEEPDTEAPAPAAVTTQSTKSRKPKNTEEVTKTGTQAETQAGTTKKHRKRDTKKPESIIEEVE